MRKEMKWLVRFKKLALIKALFYILFYKLERGHEKQQGVCQSLWANHYVTIQTFFIFFINTKESHVGMSPCGNSLKIIVSSF